jgi:hypothetical protein
MSNKVAATFHGARRTYDFLNGRVTLAELLRQAFVAGADRAGSEGAGAPTFDEWLAGE